jgi:urea transport system substrate-binding protein
MMNIQLYGRAPADQYARAVWSADPWRFDQRSQRPTHPAFRRNSQPLKVGLLVPFHGSDAIWGPSCQYSAMLGAAEINTQGGICGRQVALYAADAGGAPEGVVERTRVLVDEHGVDALIGVHLSSVRVALRDAFAGRLPYVFAPLYEGGEATPGVFAIGETPQRQFPAAVDWLMESKGLRRWFLAGNDYIWPRATHGTIRALVEERGGEIVGESYIELGEEPMDALISSIQRLRPQVVFESFVGSDCVRFNRAFSRAGLADECVRISGAVEENTLLGIGARYTRNLYCVGGYFNALRTQENQSFLGRYQKAFGLNAPVQSALSQSCYEALQFFKALADSAGGLDIPALSSAFEGLRFSGGRGPAVVRHGEVQSPIYLARASGIHFKVVEQF